MIPRQIGAILIASGLILALFGLLVWSGALSWFGRLPGDIRIGTERSRVFIPVTSSILLSIALSLVLYLLRKIF